MELSQNATKAPKTDAAQLREELQRAQHTPDKVPTIIKRLIQEPTYPQDLTQLLAAAVEPEENVFPMVAAGKSLDEMDMGRLV